MAGGRRGVNGGLTGRRKKVSLKSSTMNYNTTGESFRTRYFYSGGKKDCLVWISEWEGGMDQLSFLQGGYGLCPRNKRGSCPLGRLRAVRQRRKITKNARCPKSVSAMAGTRGPHQAFSGSSGQKSLSS